MSDPRVVRNGDLIVVADRFRIEAGPRRKVAVATAELLSNEVTADHYQEGALDSFGEPIVLGQPMHYVDWLGDSVFKIYECTGEPFEGSTEPRWVQIAEHEDEESAIAAALAAL